MSKQTHSRSNDNEDDRIGGIEYSLSLSEFHTIAHRVCQVLMPVTLCSIYVTILVKLSDSDVTKSESIMSRAWSRLGLLASTQGGQPVGKAILGSLYLVLIFLALIVIITLVMLFVLYMKWHSCLTYYFYIPSLLIMAVITPGYFRVIGKSLSWFAFDLITIGVFTLNFTALGMMAIFGLYGHTPLILQQLYLIHNSSLVAVLIVNLLPGWAPWMLLVFLVIWDLFAVLAPFGPLNLIVSMAERSGIVDMPGLVYSTDVPLKDKESSRKKRNQDNSDQAAIIHRDEAIAGRHNNDDITNRIKTTDQREPEPVQVESELSSKTVEPKSSSISKKEPERTSERKSMEEKGVNIGLGDFIFYGLLIGITAKGQNPGQYYTTLACFNSIQVGLIATLAILALTRRTLPALPISIGLGLMTVGLSSRFVSSLANTLATEQIFI